jgi:hypothetical protein
VRDGGLSDRERGECETSSNVEILYHIKQDLGTSLKNASCASAYSATLSITLQCSMCVRVYRSHLSSIQPRGLEHMRIRIPIPSEEDATFQPG